MQREIIFRGKRIDNGKWVEGYYVAYRVTGGGDLYHHIKNANDTFPIILETVGQFTGLLDKNGKKIFEGDTATTTFFNHGSANTSIIQEVKFEKGTFTINSADV